MSVVLIMVIVLKFRTLKCLTKKAYADSADPNQTASERTVRSESLLFVIPLSI